jgi:hypothetical protein
MENKFLIPSLFVILFVALVCLHYLYAPPPGATPNMQNIIFMPSVKGCAETAKGETARAINGTEQAPRIEVVGNQIKYSRALHHLCCRKATVEQGMSGPSISIYEDWSGIGCKCICFSEIEASISNVQPGSYVVNVYEKGTRPDSGERMEQKLLITQNVHVQ